MARDDLKFLMIFLCFSDGFRVFLPVFLGSRRLWGDSGKVRRRCGEPWEGLGKALSFLTQEFLNLSALRAVRHRASAVVIELDFLKLSSTCLKILPFNNYHSEDSRNSGSRGIELSLKGTAVLY